MASQTRAARRRSSSLTLLLVAGAMLCVDPASQQTTAAAQDTPEATTLMPTAAGDEASQPNEELTTETYTSTTTPTSTSTTTSRRPSVLEQMRAFSEKFVSPHAKTLARFVIRASVSGECQLFLLRFGQGLRNVEPWALRLVDASGRLPSVGLFQGTLSEPGAFDECVETVLRSKVNGEETMRAHYCNAYLKSQGDYIDRLANITALSHRRTPKFISFQSSEDVRGLRIGLCISDECSADDLQKLADSFNEQTGHELTIGTCVSGLPRPLDKSQIIALTILGIVVAAVCVGTAVDLVSSYLDKKNMGLTDTTVSKVNGFHDEQTKKLDRLADNGLIINNMKNLGYVNGGADISEKSSVNDNNHNIINDSYMNDNNNNNNEDEKKNHIDVDSTARKQREGALDLLRRIFICFSARANTRLLLEVNSDPTSDAYRFRFLHGIKFISIYGVVLGHAYSVFDFTAFSRLVNALHSGDSIWFCVVMAAYLCVDTFFFVGGFLLTYNVVHARRREGHLRVSVIALLRRFIRGTLPGLFVMAMVFLVPLAFTGPGVLDMYTNYHTQFSRLWYSVLLQFRNFYLFHGKEGTSCMDPLWYLSADFQMFVVVIILLALTNHNARSFHWLTVCVSVGCALFSAVWICGTIKTPFVLPMAENWEIIKQTLTGFYTYTTTHASCFLAGASTYLLVRDHSQTKISSITESLLWLGSITCGLFAVFGTYPWNSGNYPGEVSKFIYTLLQRPSWALFLTWLVFACATNRAPSVVRGLLASTLFTPLSRLTLGIYLSNLPIYFIESATARERIFFSNISMISRSFSMMVWSLMASYLLFLLVEAPLGRLEKLILQKLADAKFIGQRVPRSLRKPPSSAVTDANSNELTNMEAGMRYSLNAAATGRDWPGSDWRSHSLSPPERGACGPSADDDSYVALKL